MLREYVICFSFWWLVLAGAWPADAAELGAQLAEMLDYGSKPSPKSLQAARDLYGRCKSEWSGDPCANYAFALVLIQHCRYEEALSIIPRPAPSHGEVAFLAGRTRICLLLKKGNHRDAVEEIPALADLLAQPRAAPGDFGPANDLCRFLGRVFAYLEGPHRGSLPLDELQPCKQRLLAGLSSATAAAFAEGFAETNQRYTQLKAKYEKARAEQTRSDAGQQRQLAAARAELARRQQDLQAKRKAAADQIQGELADVEAKWAAAGKGCTKAQADGVRLQWELRRKRAELAELGSRVSRKGAPLPNPGEQTRVRGEIGRLEEKLTRRRADVASWQFLGLTILKQRNELLLKHQEGASQWAEELASLDLASRELDKQTQELSRPVTARSAKLRAMKAELAAFSSYEEFSRERERQRFLALLKE